MSRTRGENDQQMQDLSRQIDVWRDKVRQVEDDIRAQSRGRIISGLDSAVAQARDRRLKELEGEQSRLSSDLDQASKPSPSTTR